MKIKRKSRSQRSLLERSTMLDELDGPPLATWAVAFGILVVVLFVAWSAFAVVEEVAQAPGAIGAAEEAVRVQHPSGGVIAEIFVHEGSRIQAGERLLRFDPVVSDSVLAQSRFERLSLVARRIKLKALIANNQADFAPLGDDGSGAAADQKRLFEAELGAAKVKESILELQEAQKRSEIENLDARFSDVEKQLVLAKEDRAIRVGLAERGTVPRTQVIVVEREVASLEAELNKLPADRRRAQDALAEVDARRQEYRAERMNRYSDELAAVNDRLNQLDESAKSLEHGAGSLEVRSPIDGYVLGLGVAGKGEVVRPGEVIASIVPKEKGGFWKASGSIG